MHISAKNGMISEYLYQKIKPTNGQLWLFFSMKLLLNHRKICVPPKMSSIKSIHRYHSLIVSQNKLINDIVQETIKGIFLSLIKELMYF